MPPDSQQFARRYMHQWYSMRTRFASTSLTEDAIGDDDGKGRRNASYNTRDLLTAMSVFLLISYVAICFRPDRSSLRVADQEKRASLVTSRQDAKHSDNVIQVVNTRCVYILGRAIIHTRASL